MRDDRPEFVRMEADLHFAGRHGTECGDDPVFDALYDYAADLRECLREIVNADANGSRCSGSEAWYRRNIARYNDALKAARRLLRRKA